MIVHRSSFKADSEWLRSTAASPQTMESGGFAVPGHRAFTLMEMVIVIGILAVIAAVVVPTMRSQETQSLESTADILAADLQLARSMAIGHNTEWTVRFDFADNTYELVHTGTGNPPPPNNPLAPAGQRDNRYLVALGRMGSTSTRGNGVRLSGAVTKNSRTPVAEVTFGPLGGTGPARGEDTVIWLVTAGAIDVRYVRMVVSWVTGQVWVDRPKMFTDAASDELFQ